MLPVGERPLLYTYRGLFLLRMLRYRGLSEDLWECYQFVKGLFLLRMLRYRGLSHTTDSKVFRMDNILWEYCPIQRTFENVTSSWKDFALSKEKWKILKSQCRSKGTKESHYKRVLLRIIALVSSSVRLRLACCNIIHIYLYTHTHTPTHTHTHA